MVNEWWVAEYSQSQDAFHNQPLKKSLLDNARRVIAKEPNDWVPFFVGTQEGVRKALAVVRGRQGK